MSVRSDPWPHHSQNKNPVRGSTSLVILFSFCGQTNACLMDKVKVKQTLDLINDQKHSLESWPEKRDPRSWFRGQVKTSAIADGDVNPQILPIWAKNRGWGGLRHTEEIHDKVFNLWIGILLNRSKMNERPKFDEIQFVSPNLSTLTWSKTKLVMIPFELRPFSPR